MRGCRLPETRAELVGVERIGADRVDLVAQVRMLSRTPFELPVERFNRVRRTRERPVHLEIAQHGDERVA